MSAHPIAFPCAANRKRKRIRQAKCKTNFSEIGGLSTHINLLKEIIIMPLLYADLYKHFNIKPPRGVLFYGPPGTGKTLVAGALASEISKQGNGKVVFYHRNGADVLDKWVGESERKLRELFITAIKTRPSLIFFDELDGLAPERSVRNDQVHSSVVTTLLSLMDGLEDSSGVVVIGATNRIECIDPALRRPGRFDRELFFPLPNTAARKDILGVHTKSWLCKPSSDLLDQLAESTSGCCGSDLQAICAEAVLCCVKRIYPNISQQMNLNMDYTSLKVTEEDFTKACETIAPSIHRFGGCIQRKLTPFIRPLLQRQVDKIVGHIELILPHFLNPNEKYIPCGNRYAGRLLLKGNSQQGLNNYIIPALLQRFEHLHAYVLDKPENYTRVICNALRCSPSIVVISRVDDWWDLLDNEAQVSIISMLEDLHSGLPILVIVSYDERLPGALHEHFIYKNCIYVEIDNPTTEERRAFFSPLFYGRNCMSLWCVLKGCIKSGMRRVVNESDIIIIPQSSCSKDSSVIALPERNQIGFASGFICKRSQIDRSHMRRENIARKNRQNYIATWLQSIITQTADTHLNRLETTQPSFINRLRKEINNSEVVCKVADASTNMRNHRVRTKISAGHEDKIYGLWRRTSGNTANLPIVHLELLYDALLACIFINTNNFADAYNALQKTLSSFEKI